MKDRSMKAALEALKKDGVVLMPTDTVCGLFADPSSEKACARIYSIKKRSPGKPLALLVPDRDRALAMIEEPRAARNYIDRYWPGPVTFVFKASSGGTVALRMPDCPPLLEILGRTGPLAATSANISDRPAPAKLDEVDPEIMEACDAVCDFEFTPSGKPSRIIDLTGAEPESLR